MNDKATARPWEVCSTTKGAIIYGARQPVTPEQVERFGCDPASVVAPTICELKTGNNGQANAAFIVRAANSHADLVTACRGALPFLEPGTYHHDAITQALEKANERE